MAETILFSLAEEVLKNLRSDALTEISSAWGFKTQLNKLKNTINTLKGVLLDAEEKQLDNRVVGEWLERLSTVVYAADDLFDEFNAVAARKQLKGGHKLTKEVCTFFSHSNQVALAFKISRKIKKIREKLDAIEKDGERFGFVRRSLERGNAMSRRRDQTASYVNKDDVVGREDDKKAILNMLLGESSSSGHENGHDEGLPVISIVGMGGMGKTTLAQFVYNDPQVEYFDLRLWVCVSDGFDIKVIIEKLLKSATYEDHPNLDIDQLHGRLRNKVDGKKCLFVLDDVWNDDRLKWVELLRLLKIGRKGSKILVTTRLREVARIVGPSSAAYDLQELSEEKSWKLFEKMAFINPEEAQQKSDLVKIGKEIIKQCRGVPLAIKTLGCLLYGKEEEEWLSIKNKSLANILDNQNIVMDILKFSYHHLLSPLKKCFAYCALFPKDYEFNKEMLKDLWIAEGFIVPVEGQSLDEAAEDYFRTLLQRGFFQDIKRNDLEVIESFKMHDLMHDLAQEVAGGKCKVAEFDERDFDDKILHLSLAFKLTSSWEIPKSMLNIKLLRTFLPLEQRLVGYPPNGEFNSQELVARCRCLRVLDLRNLGLKSLPSSIGKLIHLRYLNLSYTTIEKLSDSITNLWNLQTLKLHNCTELRALPANLKKLINLRCLHVGVLSHMPSGLGGLTLLSSLPRFIVDREHDAADSRYKPTPTAKLSDLKNLNKLRGSLVIDIKGSLENSEEEAREAELRNKHQLTELVILFPDGEATNCKHDEDVLGGLEPPCDIKGLRIEDYRGQNLPSWAIAHNLCTTLPNLVEIELYKCKRCQQLPAFGQLRFLKRLKLIGMESVEYMESHDVRGVPSSSSSTSSIFFPCLEQLALCWMTNLKGWWKEVEASVNENDTSESERASNEITAQDIPTTFPKFPKLSIVLICCCPNLRWLPLFPNVEDMSVEKRLSLRDFTDLLGRMVYIFPSSSPTRSGLKLHIDNVDGDVFTTLSSSLRSLDFSGSYKLRSIAKGLENLIALETLELRGCEEVDLWGDEEEGMPWKALNTTLRSLTLWGLDQLVGLPRGLQHLSNLRSLTLSSNRELEQLPEWMSCLSSLEYLELAYCPKLTTLPEAIRQLTSLNHLDIIRCPGLTERCKEGPNGTEWPKIQHIPRLSVHDKPPGPGDHALEEVLYQLNLLVARSTN